MKKPSKSTYTITLSVLALLLAAAMILYYLPGFHYLTDATADGLLKEIFVRFAALCLIAFFVATSADRWLFAAHFDALPKSLVVSLPCFAVAIVNFPFSALIGGTATVTRTDLIWMLVLDCIFIGLFEELFFRGMLQNMIGDKFLSKRGGVFITVLITSVLFGFFHLINLASGAGLAGTLLQVVYTFLIGAMLSFVMLITKDLWLCVIIHSLFDIGGALIPKLGTGLFQDTIFWILTVAVGVLCGVYVFVGLIRLQKKHDTTIEE